MKLTSVRDFKTKATQYLSDPEEIVVTRHGKPIAVLTHVKNDSPGALLLELRGILKRSGVSKKEILSALEEARKEVYR
jgi:antitoxin (DNA-binding transcriptional repressor) of toxin-antitoxin stability system